MSSEQSKTAQEPGEKSDPNRTAQEPGDNSDPNKTAREPGSRSDPNKTAQEPGAKSDPNKTAQEPGTKSEQFARNKESEDTQALNGAEEYDMTMVYSGTQRTDPATAAAEKKRKKH